MVGLWRAPLCPVTFISGLNGAGRWDSALKLTIKPFSTHSIVKMNRINGHIHEIVAQLYRDESRRIFATLIRLLGDFELAEEALQEAFNAALMQWRTDDLPANPRAWLVSTGHFKAIDQLRKQARFNHSLADLAAQLEDRVSDSADWAEDKIEDDRLRLIFTCCHPSLTIEAQLALTLREVCGLTTEEIARACLTKPSTLAQRIVRAKSKIRDAGIPYEIPDKAALTRRLEAVLKVIYLIFNEGYSASSGERFIREELANEAIRLGRLLIQRLPEPEVQGLLALMLLHDARRAARIDQQGNLVLLEDQDRSRWNQAQIKEGAEWVRQALRSRRFGSYTLQAAIAAVHAEAKQYQETDWSQIIGLYEALLQVNPTPVVALNRAVAVAMRDGAQAGLTLIDALLERGDLTGYHLIFAAKADLHRRLNQMDQAKTAYQRALNLAEPR